MWMTEPSTLAPVSMRATCVSAGVIGGVFRMTIARLPDIRGKRLSRVSYRAVPPQSILDELHTS